MSLRDTGGYKGSCDEAVLLTLGCQRQESCPILALLQATANPKAALSPTPLSIPETPAPALPTPPLQPVSPVSQEYPSHTQHSLGLNPSLAPHNPKRSPGSLACLWGVALATLHCTSNHSCIMVFNHTRQLLRLAGSASWGIQALQVLYSLPSQGIPLLPQTRAGLDLTLTPESSCSSPVSVMGCVVSPGFLWKP